MLAFAASPVAADTQVRLNTSHGPILVELFDEKAPATVDNFLTYVRDGFYEGTIFHRVIPGFVVQVGGFTAEFERKAVRDPIENEAGNGLKNRRGTLSMARTNDPHSATSQFFINLADNDFLDRQAGKPGYAVFGRVIEGLDNVEAIAAIPTGAAGPFRQDVPRETVRIESADIVEPAE
ncbi:peptidylprolyl isomerase [Guyparkeria halopsychrophila]|uniref:peptidylprolyl isomerase n=1 Tax=Guyparkeria halopsychrophila TaxID=3139421 RepID=UPI0037CA05A7